VRETPCPYSERLSELTGTRCFVKLENLQKTGSFKERGAANVLLQLDAAERGCGVVAASAGNHGLAVAFHASRLGIPATIVMPEWAPLIKVASASRYGAEVILHGANFDEACARALELGAERGTAFVHPFDDARVIAGQGTIGLELLEQCPGLDAVLVAIGGGGLAAGVAAMLRSVDSGHVVTLPAASTLADGIAVRRVGALTFDLVRRHVDRIVTVAEEEIANAILLLLEIEKTVVEGAGAAPLAAAINRALGLEGATVAVLLSGGNIDVTMLSRIIERGLVKDGRLVRLGVLLRDRPGELSRLTATIAAARANILHIEHNRAFSRAAIGETEVELTLETSGRPQIAELLRTLRATGYRVEERTR
jgi:threonine dehydratase